MSPHKPIRKKFRKTCAKFDRTIPVYHSNGNSLKGKENILQQLQQQIEAKINPISTTQRIQKSYRTKQSNGGLSMWGKCNGVNQMCA